MFDTMKMTKAVGGVCGALLVFLLISWAAEAMFNPGEEITGEEPAPQAYTVDTGAAEATTETVDAGPTFAEVFAAADAAAGEKVFAKCKSCHSVEGKDGTGPHLNGVVGRARGSVAGFGYSEGMASEHNPWTPEEIDLFLTNPKADVAGTKMSFAGLPKVQDRANVIAYLATLQ